MIERLFRLRDTITGTHVGFGFTSARSAARFSRWAAAVCAVLCVTSPARGGEAGAPAGGQPKANLALVAKASTSFVTGHETIAALNDGFELDL